MPCDSSVLPGFYRALFLYIEPLLTIAGTAMIWFLPGAEWFRSQLVPGSSSSGALDAPTTVAMQHFGNAYLVIGMTSWLGFRAIENTLPGNPEAQERILGASLTVLAFCDVPHVVAAWTGLPEELRFAFGSWNPMTHGNITFTIFLFAMRLAWFAGIGRQRFYYGKTARESRKLA